MSTPTRFRMTEGRERVWLCRYGLFVAAPMVALAACAQAGVGEPWALSRFAGFVVAVNLGFSDVFTKAARALVDVAPPPHLYKSPRPPWDAEDWIVAAVVVATPLAIAAIWAAVT